MKRQKRFFGENEIWLKIAEAWYSKAILCHNLGHYDEGLNLLLEPAKVFGENKMWGEGGSIYPPAWFSFAGMVRYKEAEDQYNKAIIKI